MQILNMKSSLIYDYEGIAKKMKEMNPTLSPEEPSYVIIPAENGKQAVYKILTEYMEGDVTSPRDWSPTENLSTIVAWHKRYNLCDKAVEGEYVDPEDFYVDMIKKHVPNDVILKKILSGQINVNLLDAANNMLDYSGDMYLGTEKEDSENSNKAFMEEIIECCLSTSEMLSLLNEAENFLMLPVYLYDHSGITVSTSDFGDRWDSGQVGWIYTDKLDEIAADAASTIEEKKEAAKKALVSELNLYDQYLSGDVKWVSISKAEEDWDGEANVEEFIENATFEEIDSCSDFYSDDNIIDFCSSAISSSAM